MPLPELLRQSLALCNRLGRPVTAGVFILGAVLVALQVLMWMQAEPVLQKQIQIIVGEERWTELQTALAGSGAATLSVNELATTLTTELETKLNAMTVAERGAYLQTVAEDIVSEAGAGIWITVFVLIILFLFSRAYFLTLVSNKTERIVTAFSSSIVRFPHFLLAWTMVGIAACIWLPFVLALGGFLQSAALLFVLPSLIFPILLLPRFIFAPILVLRGQVSLRHSLEKSFALTRGRWWEVTKSLVGVSVTVWIAMTVLQTFLQMLVSMTVSYSFFGFLLYALTPFLALIASAYRSAGLTVITDSLRRG